MSNTTTTEPKVAPQTPQADPASSLLPKRLVRARPLFDAIGQKTWVVGDRPSQANVVKICGNFMLASAIETLSEASALANAYGVPTRTLFEVMTSTLFAAPAYQIYGKIIADKKFEPPGFRMKLGFKDVRLALMAGEEAKVPLPFASVTWSDTGRRRRPSSGQMVPRS